MTLEELRKTIDDVKRQGFSDEDILEGFHIMFQNGELTLDELDGLVNFMGYHLTEEFLKNNKKENK